LAEAEGFEPSTPDFGDNLQGKPTTHENELQQRMQGAIAILVSVYMNPNFVQKIKLFHIKQIVNVIARSVSDEATQ
jgi:hypothetical protein